MAVTQANLTSGGTATNAAIYTTASVTPSANKLILVSAASASKLGGTNDRPTLTGNGLTWVEVSHVYSDTPSHALITVFRGMGASPSSGAITIDYGANTQGTCGWTVDEFGGVNTSGTNGSGAVVGSATGVFNASSGTVTLSAFASDNNATYGTWTVSSDGDNITDITPGAGFTEIADVLMEASSSNRIETEWKNSNDTSVDASWDGTIGGSKQVAVAIEIAAGTAFIPRINIF